MKNYPIFAFVWSAWTHKLKLYGCHFGVDQLAEWYGESLRAPPSIHTEGYFRSNWEAEPPPAPLVGSLMQVLNDKGEPLPRKSQGRQGCHQGIVRVSTYSST